MFNSVMSVLQWYYTNWLKCTQVTLGIRMLKSIFLLHTKTQNYQFKYPNELSVIL